MSVKSDSPIRPGSCICRKITSCSAPCSARQDRIRRSSVRRIPGESSGWRRNISSKIATVAIRAHPSQRHDFCVEDRLERIGAPALPASCISAKEAAVLRDAEPRGAAEIALGGGHLDRLGLSQLHEKPRLLIGTCGPAQSALPQGKPQRIGPTAITDDIRSPRCGGPVLPVGLRPPSTTGPHASHPD